MATTERVQAVPGRQSSTGWAKATALVPYLLLLAAAYSVFCVTQDDPYITFRYAANLLAGHGPVFNVGERVEGFTSPLHLFVSVLLLKVAPGTDILFKAKLFSLGMGLLVLAQTRVLARRAGLRERPAVLAQLLVALNLNFAISAVNGLETTLYVFWITAALAAFLHEDRRPGLGSAGLLFLALLTRPDALLPFAALLIVRLAAYRRRHQSVGPAVRWAAAFLVPSLVLVAARMAYYGQPLPNTYYAKQVGLRDGLKNGAHYLMHPLSQGTLHPAMGHGAALLFWGLVLLGGWARRGRPATPVLLAAAAAEAFFVLRAGGDWMPGWRFMMPVLPALAVLQAQGVRHLAAVAARRFRAPPCAQVFGGAALLIWCLTLAASPHCSWARAGFTTHGARLLRVGGMYGAYWVDVGDYIHTRFRPGSYVAYSEMGYAGYANLDKRFLDTRGLTESHLCRLYPVSRKSMVGITDDRWYAAPSPLFAELIERQPDAIISFDYQRPIRVALGQYLRDTSVGPMPAAPDGKATLVFLRRGSRGPALRVP